MTLIWEYLQLYMYKKYIQFIRNIYMHWYPYHQLIDAVTEKNSQLSYLNTINVTVLYLVILTLNSLNICLFIAPDINLISVNKITAIIHEGLKKRA